MSEYIRTAEEALEQLRSNRVPDLKKELCLAPVILDVLRNPDEPQDALDEGINHLRTAGGMTAQRVVSQGGMSNVILVEVPNTGVWTFDGTTGKLLTQ